MRVDVDKASATKAERDSVQKPGSSVVTELTAKIKSDFALNARGQILQLLEAVRDHISVSSDIVQGLSSFDPNVLFCQTREQVARSFDVLYGSFQLRKWVSEGDTSLYRDEYNELVDFLRVSQPILKKDPGVIPDIVIFLSQMEALQTRVHLRYLFELCCLCLTETATSLPVIKTSFIDTSDYRCKYTEFIQPVQSYLSTVPDGVAVCTSDTSLSAFNSLLSESEVSSFEPSLDPWEEFDLFGCRKIFKSLDSSYKSLESPIPTAPRSSASSTIDRPLVQTASVGKIKRVAFGGSKIPKKRQSPTDSVEAGTSKESPTKGSSKSSSRRSSVSDAGSGNNAASS